jgi:hypothetical protein
LLPTVNQILPMELSGDLRGFSGQLQRVETKEEDEEKRRHTQ